MRIQRVDTKVLRAADDLPLAQLLDHLAVAPAAYLGEACDAAYGLLALLCRAAQEQVGDAFLADDVRHVVSVDHDGCQIELEFLGEIEAIELLHEDRHHLLAKALDELDDQFTAARQMRMPIACF